MFCKISGDVQSSALPPFICILHSRKAFLGVQAHGHDVLTFVFLADMCLCRLRPRIQSVVVKPFSDYVSQVWRPEVARLPEQVLGALMSASKQYHSPVRSTSLEAHCIAQEEKNCGM